jgi:hypothetical protein
MPAPNRKLPSYSAVWFAPSQVPGDTTDGNQAVVELFHRAADAMTWASDRVEERGVGAVAAGLQLDSPTPLMSIATTSRSPASRAATSIQSYEKNERPWVMRTGDRLGQPKRR